MVRWQNDISKIRCFSLGDFHDFTFCPFRFFVNHHLGKKYELAEGSEALALGSLLDMAIKKLHAAKAYNLPVDYLPNLIKGAQSHIREQAAKEGARSFYGPIIPFLTEAVILKAQEIFKNYYLGVGGRVKMAIHKNKLKPFWKYTIQADEPLVLWGGADGIELGEDGLPEVVDYKYYQEKGVSYYKLDMDLMPKLYTLLAARELIELGFTKARFILRLWNDPKNNDFYEEFDLTTINQLEPFFIGKIEKILRTTSLSFCNKDFCKACKSDKRGDWIKELRVKFNLG